MAILLFGLLSLLRADVSQTPAIFADCPEVLTVLTDPGAEDLGFLTFAFGDFDGDGRLDSGGPASNSTVSPWMYRIVFQESGGRTWRAMAFPRPVEWKDHHQALASDLNRNGCDDLIVLASEPSADGQTDEWSLEVLLGSADRRMVALPPVDVDCHSLKLGDFNGDGAVDLCGVAGLSGVAAEKLEISFGTGSGHFLAGVEIAFFPPWERFGSVRDFCVADFDRDGRDDVAVAIPGSSTSTRFLFGRADGLREADWSLTLPTGGGDLVSADFEGDGWPDLALTRTYDRGCHRDEVELMLLRNANGGVFSNSPLQRLAGLAALLTAKDLDRDGRPELLAWTRGGALEVYRGDAQGRFERSAAYLASGIVYDLDGDGAVDLLSGGVLIRGNPDGSFRAPMVILERPEFPYAVLGDVDGDGTLDLVLLGTSGEWLCEFNSLNILVHPGRGDGEFFEPYAVDFLLDRVLEIAEDVRLVDVDGDDSLDLLLLAGGRDEPAAEWRNLLLVLLGDGRGGLGRPTVTPAPGWGSMEPGDLDGDGALDIALRLSDRVAILLGDGEGTFRDTQSCSTGASPRAHGLGDFDGDGRLDLVFTDLDFSAGQSGIRLVTCLGRGDGTLSEPSPSRFQCSLPGSGLRLADFDEDGRLDILLLSQRCGPQGGCIAFGTGDGRFEHHPLVSSLSHVSRAACVADLDRDGHLDIVAPSSKLGVLFGAGDGTFPPVARVSRTLLGQGARRRPERGRIPGCHFARIRDRRPSESRDGGGDAVHPR